MIRSFAFLVPGRIDQLTGGYLYDRRVVEGLRAAGRDITVCELAGSFPEADAAARAAFAAALGGLPDGAAAVIDGLALPGGAECLAAAADRLVLVGFVHHPLADETGLAPGARARVAALEARLLGHLRGAICPSAATARGLEAYGMAASRLAVVPPGTEKPASLPAARRAAAPLLLTVATLTPRKGHLLLVEALARLADRPWRLLCLGSTARDPATADRVRAAIDAAGLGGRIELAGELPPGALAAAYEAADIFVLPSFHEGYGMAFAEAMAHGLPVIGAGAGAVPDLVPETAGILVPPGDVDALAAALASLLDDPGRRARLAEGARRAGAALPDWPETARRWGAALDRLAA